MRRGLNHCAATIASYFAASSEAIPATSVVENFVSEPEGPHQVGVETKQERSVQVSNIFVLYSF